MSYAISVSVGGYFSAQTRAKVSIYKITRSVLTFLTRAMTPKPDVFMAVERFDALLTERDNQRIETAKLLALKTAT